VWRKITPKSGPFSQIGSVGSIQLLSERQDGTNFSTNFCEGGGGLLPAPSVVEGRFALEKVARIIACHVLPSQGRGFPP
jgi:hypothetical protein